MRRVQSSLEGTGFAIVVIAGANLFLLLCLCVLLGYHRMPRFGMNIRPAASHFVMGSYDRTATHILTVTPGETPRLFLEEKEIPGGLSGLEDVLRQWDSTHPSRVTVILMCDEAVSAGTIRQLTDAILSHGFTCAFAGRPALD